MVEQIAVELLDAMITPIMFFVLVSGIFDLCLAVFTILTFFMEKHDFIYWSRFKLGITEDAITAVIFLVLSFIFLGFLIKSDEFLIFLLGVLFTGAIALTLMIGLIRYILEVKSRNSLVITAKLIFKCKHHRWAIHCCEIELNGKIEKVLLPEKSFLNKNYDVCIGEIYDLEVFKPRGSGYYRLISVTNCLERI